MLLVPVTQTVVQIRERFLLKVKLLRWGMQLLRALLCQTGIQTRGRYRLMMAILLQAMKLLRALAWAEREMPRLQVLVQQMEIQSRQRCCLKVAPRLLVIGMPQAPVCQMAIRAPQRFLLKAPLLRRGMELLRALL